MTIIKLARVIAQNNLIKKH